MPKPKSPEREWQQQLIDDYYDYRWKQILEPLYQEFLRWKSGELAHADMDQAIHKTHKQTQELYGLFGEKRDWLARVIQMDEDWFEVWLKDHPAPESLPLIPRAVRA